MFYSCFWHTQQSTVIYTHDKSYKIGGHYTMYIHINKISRLELGHDSLSFEVYYLKGLFCKWKA